MIITGLNFPTSFKKRLSSAVANVHRETASLAVSDLRKRPQVWDGRDGSHLCYFHMTFSQKGAVKGLDARLLMKPHERFRRHGFEAEVPLFGRADRAAWRVMPTLAEFLVNREVELRKSHGLREMINWTTEELQDAIRIRSYSLTEALRTSQDCGTISEVLRARLAEQELASRESESQHARMQAMSENQAFLQLCQKTVAEEYLAAQHWAEDKEAGGWYVHKSYMFQNRSEEDQIAISYRDRMGW